jgi:hypothetical protein
VAGGAGLAGVSIPYRGGWGGGGGLWCVFISDVFVWVSAVRKEFQTSRKGAYRQDGEVKGVPKPLHLPP